MPRGFTTASGYQLKSGLKPLAESLLDALRKHRRHCEEKGLMRKLEEAHIKNERILKYFTTHHPGFKVSEADVRAIVNYLRRRGEPIGSSSHGYFLAGNPEELKTTIDSLWDREMAIRGAREGLEQARQQLQRPPVYPWVDNQ